MKENRTELVFILDRSGSMYGLETDTVGGFNSTLEANRELPGDCIVTTVLFNHDVTLLHDRLDAKAVRPMTKADYCPGGCTALLDAIGFAMDKLQAVQRSVSAEHCASKVQFVIMTDGLENASREYTLAMIRKRITEAKQQWGWEFLFLGANIDAISTAENLGINANRAVNAIADSEGMQAQFRAVAKASCAYRSGNAAAYENWASEVLADRQRRK